MSRLVCLLLALAMVGCAQHVTPIAETGSQPMMQNVGAIAAKPAEPVHAYVEYKNEDLEPSLFAVQWSYAANPFWHLELEKCVRVGDRFDTQVVYNHIKEGPQIKFDVIRSCQAFGKLPRTVSFHAINFDPSAHFHVEFRFDEKTYHRSLCARGGGNKKVCHTF